MCAARKPESVRWCAAALGRAACLTGLRCPDTHLCRPCRRSHVIPGFRGARREIASCHMPSAQGDGRPQRRLGGRPRHPGAARGAHQHQRTGAAPGPRRGALRACPGQGPDGGGSRRTRARGAVRTASAWTHCKAPSGAIGIQISEELPRLEDRGGLAEADGGRALLGNRPGRRRRGPWHERIGGIPATRGVGTRCSRARTRARLHRAKRRQTVGRQRPNTGGDCRHVRPGQPRKPSPPGPSGHRPAAPPWERTTGTDGTACRNSPHCSCARQSHVRTRHGLPDDRNAP